MTEAELRADKLAGIKCRMAERRREKARNYRPMKRPPRYDKTFFEGIAAWEEAIANGEEEDQEI